MHNDHLIVVIVISDLTIFKYTFISRFASSLLLTCLIRTFGILIVSMSLEIDNHSGGNNDDGADFYDSPLQTK